MLKHIVPKWKGNVPTVHIISNDMEINVCQKNYDPELRKNRLILPSSNVEYSAFVMWKI